MAISVSARTGDQQHLLEVFRHTISSQLRVAMPGIVQSFTSFAQAYKILEMA